MLRASVRVLPIQAGLTVFDRLLHRQISLIDYLTSAAVLLGDKGNVAADPALQGIDKGVLRLVARFCHNRRIKKILGAFPRTLEILGADQWLMLRAFVETERQADISNLASAHQFYEFLVTHWRREPPKLPYLPDVAACEFLMVKVCNIEDSEKSLKTEKSGGPSRAVRRYRTVVPMRCAFDVRSVFEAGLGEVAPGKRDTLLVVTLPADSRNARILEVTPIVFDLLVRLEDWVEPIKLSTTGDLEFLISHLDGQQLIEVRT
jgi:hypothetical protein